MSEETTALYASSPSHRVEVCCLDKNNRWAVEGTGSCVYLKGNGDDPDELVVRSETDSNLLLSSCVYAEKTYHNYQTLGETKISWTDFETNGLAINFEDAKSRDDIWLRMCDKRGVIGQTWDLDESLYGDSDGADTVIMGEVDLPTPTKTNLDEIAKILEDTTRPEKSDLASFIVDNCYVNKLFIIFEECERANKINRLHELFIIMKFIILLSSSRVLEHITSDENVIPVASILEYDTATAGMKENHREILKAHSLMEPVKPKVVPLSDPTIMLTIRRTYRFQYLMDVIMARYLDENLSSTLQGLIFRNQIDTLDYLKHDTNFLENVFRIIKNRDPDEIKQTQAVQAVLQLCTFSKFLKDDSRSDLYRKLATYGLFIPIEIAVSSEDSGMHHAAVEALSLIVKKDVDLLRSHILSQQQPINSGTGNNERNLLQCIINQVTSATDPDLIYQYDDILVKILELVVNRRSRFKFYQEVNRNKGDQLDCTLKVFYDKYAPSLLYPLMSIENKPMNLDGPIAVLEHGQDQGEVYSHLLDILCSAVEQHGDQSKAWMASGDCFVKVAQLYRSRFDWVKLAALHFFRVCVGLMDDDYNKQLIKHNVFESTIRLLLDANGNWSAVNSNCLELLEFIRHKNPKLLVSHLIERFGSELDTVDYISTCSELRKQYNENQKQLNTLATFASSALTLFYNISSSTRNETNQTTSLDRSEEGKSNESNVEDDRRPHDSGDRNDPVLSSVSLASLTAEPLPSKEEKGRRPPLKDTTNDNEDAASAVDNDSNNTTGDHSPLRSPKHKRDNDDDDDESEALAAKVSKRSGQDKPSVLKRTPRRSLAAAASDEEKDTIALDSGNDTTGGPSSSRPRGSLKHKRDGDNDDNEEDERTAKRLKRLGQEKPAIWRRISKCLMRAVTSDNRGNTTAIDNDSYTKSSLLMLKQMFSPLLGAKTSDDEQESSAIDNENSTTENPVLPIPLRSLKRKVDDEDDNEGARAIR